MLFIKSSRPRSPNSLHKYGSKEEVERLGLARRLHETLAQDLAAIGYQLDALIGDHELAQSQRSELRSIRLEVMRVAQEFRDEIYQLRVITRTDLEIGLKELLVGLALDVDLSYPGLIASAEQLLNEVLLEMARNVAKHSSATRFYLRFLNHEETLEIHVGDDGQGALTISKRSFGLRGIDEILKNLAKEYSCQSDSNGTHYRIIIDRSLLSR